MLKKVSVNTKSSSGKHTIVECGHIPQLSIGFSFVRLPYAYNRLWRFQIGRNSQILINGPVQRERVRVFRLVMSLSRVSQNQSSCHCFLSWNFNAKIHMNTLEYERLKTAILLVFYLRPYPTRLGFFVFYSAFFPTLGIGWISLSYEM